MPRARIDETGTVMPIDDPADPRLADYRELKDATARRRIEGDEFFIAEGPVAIERLIASDHRIRSILLSEQKADRLADVLDRVDAPVHVVPKAMLADIVGFDLHRGAIAAADRRSPAELDDVLAASRTIAVLEGLNDPENLGAVARSARALGIDALLLDPTCIDPYTRRTVRVSMGEILHTHWFRFDRDAWPTALDRVAAAGFETWAMTPGAETDDIWTLDRPERVAIVLGAEGPGLDRRTIAAASRRVRIPIAPDVDSLNIAAAAAVAFAVVGRGTHRQTGLR